MRACMRVCSCEREREKVGGGRKCKIIYACTIDKRERERERDAINGEDNTHTLYLVLDRYVIICFSPILTLNGLPFYVPDNSRQLFTV